MKHQWILNEDGERDDVQWGELHHNGPRCAVCREAFCVHCEALSPRTDEECPGPPEARQAELVYQDTFRVQVQDPDALGWSYSMAVWSSQDEAVAEMNQIRERLKVPKPLRVVRFRLILEVVAE